MITYDAVPPKKDGLVRNENINPQAVFEFPQAVEQSMFVCDRWPDGFETGNCRVFFSLSSMWTVAGLFQDHTGTVHIPSMTWVTNGHTPVTDLSLTQV